jgi:4-hydroxybenzoate polyprenyltransferase
LSYLIKFFLDANFVIGLCAALLCNQTFIVIGKEVSFLLLTIVFFSTVALYNLHNVVGLAGSISEKHPRYQSVRKFEIIIKLIILASIALVFSLIFYLPPSVFLLMLIVAMPSLLYVIPLFAGKRLRDISLIKILLLSCIWPFVTVMLPYSMSDAVFDTKFYLLFIERALFVFSLAIAFDIRDIEFDKLLGVKTIPIMLGKENSFILSAFVLMCWAVLLHFIYPILVALALNMLAVLTLYLIWGTMKTQKTIYYQLYLDGTMLLQALIVSLLM